ncbi:hypothetical protein ACVPOW_02845 [Staphylococcus aureus]
MRTDMQNHISYKYNFYGITGALVMRRLHFAFNNLKRVLMHMLKN